jgi:hypothetical protein
MEDAAGRQRSALVEADDPGLVLEAERASWQLGRKPVDLGLLKLALVVELLLQIITGRLAVERLMPAADQVPYVLGDDLGVGISAVRTADGAGTGRKTMLPGRNAAMVASVTFAPSAACTIR